MDTIDYRIAMLKKRKLYQQEGKRLVSLSFQDKPRLEERLRQKLSRYLRLTDDAAAAESSPPC